MGIKESFESDNSWERAVVLLDSAFALSDGSHNNVCDYIVHFGQLLVIRTDGSCTGLARPEQFVDAGGNHDEPQTIVLSHEGLEVEIELDRSRPACTGQTREHRLTLLSSIAA